MAVISPYKAQVAALREAFSAAFGGNRALAEAGIEFGTVDGFQVGGEGPGGGWWVVGAMWLALSCCVEVMCGCVWHIVWLVIGWGLRLWLPVVTVGLADCGSVCSCCIVCAYGCDRVLCWVSVWVSVWASPLAGWCVPGMQACQA